MAYGTAALCVVNAGLCLFGEAVKDRALADGARERHARQSFGIVARDLPIFVVKFNPWPVAGRILGNR